MCHLDIKPCKNFGYDVPCATSNRSFQSRVLNERRHTNVDHHDRIHLIVRRLVTNTVCLGLLLARFTVRSAKNLFVICVMPGGLVVNS